MIKTTKQAIDYLEKYIPKDREFKFPGEIGLERTAYLHRLLGDPQNKIRVIHVAGTSGKGSTSYLISIILRSLGFKVGLSVSPILTDTRERFQINSKFINNPKFFTYLNMVVKAVSRVSASKYGDPTYYEILVALTYLIFKKENVDYAVVETGLGGLLDGTNVVTSDDKVAVITQIGHDHTAILGKTLEKIAYQKAGIIHKGNLVVTIQQNPKVIKVIKQAVTKAKAKLYVVDSKSVTDMHLLPTPIFDFHCQNTKIENIELQMIGSFQVANCAIALTTVSALAQRDSFIVDKGKVKRSLKNAVFLGRMQQMRLRGQTMVIDGAHNPQKMRMLAKNLMIYYPGKKFNFLVSFRRGKNYKEILSKIIPLANKILVTPFEDQTKAQGFSALSEDTGKLAKIFKSLKFNNYSLYENSQAALEDLIKDSRSIGVITGSLYLISELYPIISKMQTASQ